ncbi:SAM-dependent methyltransferase [Streptomyces sp. NPDC057654]|uniref:SAM-dependent methyltransferase n=1 Tax=Streptomyces sp. NPDC057654 TaxID=3346196 RepID=UPI0036C54FD5
MAELTLLSEATDPGRAGLDGIGSAVDEALGLPEGSCDVTWRQCLTGTGTVICLLTTDEAGYPDTDQQTRLHQSLSKALRQSLNQTAVNIQLAVTSRSFTPPLVVSRPIATVVGGRTEIRDDNWAEVSSVIRLDPEQFPAEALSGIEDFSQLEVVFHFDRVPVAKIETNARHPRGNKDWPLVGIFAQRGKNRPNRIGVSRCRLIEVSGHDLHVKDLDAVSGTPVLDIKPYMSEYGPRSATRQPQWATELMRDYY